MRNERNVAALAELLHDIIPNSTAFGEMKSKGPVEECDFCKEAARSLAASGVLVPSALTDEQLWRFDGVQVLPHTEEPVAMRSYLERIAKGEEPVDA